MSRHDAWLHPLTITERLAAVPQASPLSRALRNRPELLEGLDAGYRGLISAGGARRREDLAVTAFAAALHGEDAVVQHFHDLLSAEDADLARVIGEEADHAALPGPYGVWPPGPLSAEDLDGPAWRADPPLRQYLGARLSAALEHTHLITLHPRDATGEDAGALSRAGWSEEEIRALNGLIAWIGALSPVVAGLRAYAFARQPHLLRDPLAGHIAGNVAERANV